MLQRSRVVQIKEDPRKGRPALRVPCEGREKEPALFTSLGCHVSVVACEAHQTMRASGLIPVTMVWRSWAPRATANFSGVTKDASTARGEVTYPAGEVERFVGLPSQMVRVMPPMSASISSDCPSHWIEEMA